MLARDGASFDELGLHGACSVRYSTNGIPEIESTDRQLFHPSYIEVLFHVIDNRWTAYMVVCRHPRVGPVRTFSLPADELPHWLEDIVMTATHRLGGIRRA